MSGLIEMLSLQLLSSVREMQKLVGFVPEQSSRFDFAALEFVRETLWLKTFFVSADSLRVARQVAGSQEEPARRNGGCLLQISPPGKDAVETKKTPSLG